MHLLSATETTLVGVFLLASMLGVGMRTGAAELRSLTASRGLLARSLAANLAVAPLVGIALALMLPLPAPSAGALMLLACAPGGPGAVQFTSKVRGGSAYAGTMACLLSLISLAASPPLMRLVLPTDVQLVIPYGRALLLVVVFMLLPLAAGMLVRSLAPGAAPIVSMLPAFLGLTAFVWLTVATGGARRMAAGEVGRGPVGVMLLFIGACMAIGWLMGGPDRGTRRMLATATSMRNVPLCLGMVHGGDPDSAVVTPLLAFSLLMVPPNLLLTISGALASGRNGRGFIRGQAGGWSLHTNTRPTGGSPIREETAMSREEVIQREILPIPDVPHVGPTTFDARDPETKFTPIEPLRPPKGAPNVLIVLIDDVGFGASSAFGGPCQTPTAERLAAGGLRYNRFHTCALCSPTRQALLTGRNHHTVGMAGITEMATSAPGYTSILPKNCAPLAQTLKLNGYSTAQFGKCHEVPMWETSPMGPFDHWPTGGGGFEYFYGFIGAETNQYYPAIYEGTTPIEPPGTPEEGYHFTTDLTRKAILWVRQQKSLVPDKPFFMYFAPGATHAPHHVPKEWADKYKGKFDQGWDKLREETFARQKKMGLVPPGCDLTKRHAEIPAWEAVEPTMKPILARQMEIYAGYLEHVDHHVGLLIDALADLEVLDDTLVYYILGDNGASAEGTMQGTFNEMATLGGFGHLETEEFFRKNLDNFGGPKAYNHYAVGWAHAMDAPYQWTKQIASHWGGTRNGCIVHWPKGIKAKGEIRSQFHHVIDVAPTVLETAKLPEPTFVNGIEQKPYEGVSMRYCFDDPKAEERHETQYFEMIGNRGIYHKGWTAVTKHRTPWTTGAIKTVPFDADVWELYDTSTDWTQAHDLSKKMPEKLRELQRLWLMEAVKYNVLPLDDRVVERANPDLSGRPTLVRGNRQVMFGGMKRLPLSSSVNILNKTHAITAEIVVPKEGAQGVIFAAGGLTGGFSLYAKEGKPRYCYNFFGLKHYFVDGAEAIPAGKHQLRMEFAYDGGGVGKGGTVSLFIDGRKAGEGRIEMTEPFGFSCDETIDIGREEGSPVSPDYGPRGNAFTGEINWIELDVDKDALDQDHMLTGAERFRVAMALQ